MVTVTTAHSEIPAQLSAGLGTEDSKRVLAALDFVRPLYGEQTIPAGQIAIDFSINVVRLLASLNADADTRIAGLLFELPPLRDNALETIERHFSKEIADLVGNVRQLMRFHERMASSTDKARGKNAAQQTASHIETLRKMLLAMATDMRAVLVRLASRVATLRYFAECKLQNEMTRQYATETFDLYAPLANRLGVWQLKWELEDLSFRFTEPETYHRIANMLEEKRVEREDFVESAIQRLRNELGNMQIKAEVSGRPKHLFSIWNKMRGKSLDFSELNDVRALRVIVDDVKTCYAVLGIVHNIWAPITKEFDDYISRPKSNGYQSLHTVVTAEDGRALEVQVRTSEMHHFAEYGVAAHWRYKEATGGPASGQRYDQKIAWLRQLLAWKSEVADNVTSEEAVQREWVEKLKLAALDDRIYVMTPQARVIELPRDATPIDFAYTLHSDVGHRCRGARVEGIMVPLNTPLKNGQTVEIITAKGSGTSGPSRDWLMPGHVVSARTRAKIRSWFNAIERQETLNNGRTQVEKTLQREGKTAIKLEDLAHRLGFAKLEDLFFSVGKEQFSLRHIEHVLHADGTASQPVPEVTAEEMVVSRKRPASSVSQGASPDVLVVGTSGLLTQLARCCKPAPPDPIVGFITRGKGVSIHRASCKNFAEMQARSPERIAPTDWGDMHDETLYPVNILVLSNDRQGLLRDISDVFLREKINVTGVTTNSRKGLAHMTFTAEIGSTAQLQKGLSSLSQIAGVQEARRL